MSNQRHFMARCFRFLFVLAFTWLALAPSARASSKSASLAASLPNGDFELGDNGAWEVSDSLNNPLIVNFAQDPVAPDAHGGSYAAWLRGGKYETSRISQTVTVTAENPNLYFWAYFDSKDACGTDFASVLVDATQVWSETTCTKTNTHGWVMRWVDLTAYAGQTVKLMFQESADVDWNSSFYLDDVSFGPSRAALYPLTSYLPIVGNGLPGSAYSEDFSVDNGRWVTGSASDRVYGYLNGEYQIRLNDFYKTQLITPDLTLCSNYRVEVDGREAVALDHASYGLMVGIGWLDNYTNYEGIQFMVQPYNQEYYIVKRTGDGNWTTLVSNTPNTGVIRVDKPNYLRVDRTGVNYKFYVNGVLVSTITDLAFTSAGRDAGLRVYSYNIMPVDVRFDNFFATCLP